MKATKWDVLLARIMEMDKWAVKIGVLKAKGGDEQIEGGGITMIGLAIAHEFGLGVPQRSFIRGGVAKYLPQIQETQVALVRKIYAGETDARTALRILGEQVVGHIRDFVVEHPLDGGWALAPATIRAKGSDRPLVDTGRLLQSITYEVVPASAA